LARPPFPTSPDQITPDWLGQALAGEAVVPERIRAVRIGQDEGFSGCRLYRLTLMREGRETTLVAKLSPSDPDKAQRLSAANAREVAFYAAHGRDTSLPLPRCHAALFDAPTGSSLLLLQDLGDHLALPFARGLGSGEALVAVQALADLHARWWDDPAPTPATPTLQEAYPFEILWPAYLDHVARVMPDLPLPGTLCALGGRIAADPDAVCAQLTNGGPLTRVHGDVQADNLRFADGPGGRRALLIDWQLTGIGAGLSDLGYLLISSLPPALRRDQEQALIGAYAAALADLGVSLGGTGGYLRAAAGKLWMTVAATLLYDNASPAKQHWRRTDLERLAAFCEDHDPAASALR
jgi:hypothetical protein